MGTKNTSIFLIRSSNNVFLGALILVLTIIASSIVFNSILELVGSLVNKNGYVYETFYYFSPIILPTIISSYLFKENKKSLAFIAIVGGVLYYLWLWFGLLWMSAEAQSPIFYGLIRPY